LAARRLSNQLLPVGQYISEIAFHRRWKLREGIEIDRLTDWPGRSLEKRGFYLFRLGGFAHVPNQHCDGSAHDNDSTRD
jgi:hypothetical protein